MRFLPSLFVCVCGRSEPLALCCSTNGTRHESWLNPSCWAVGSWTSHISLSPWSIPSTHNEKHNIKQLNKHGQLLYFAFADFLVCARHSGIDRKSLINLGYCKFYSQGAVTVKVSSVVIGAQGRLSVLEKIHFCAEWYICTVIYVEGKEAIAGDTEPTCPNKYWMDYNAIFKKNVDLSTSFYFINLDYAQYTIM